MRLNIPAVHKQKLKEFLKKLEVWESFSRGELTCACCGTTISLDNIGFIIPSDEDILFCCSNIDCIYKIKKLRRGESENED